MRAGMNMGLGTLLASTNPFAYVLSTLRSAGVSITNQLLADQWAYQQRALALYPGQPAKCVLFQDAAGTTPVTAVEQPIGLALDLETAGTWDGVTAISSLPGTHMRQSTTSKRAMLSARVNLLERTQEFDNAYWTKSSGAITPNATTAPDWTLTAARFVPIAGTGVISRISRTIATSVVGTTYTFSIRAKLGEIRYLRLLVTSITSPNADAYFDLHSGVTGNATSCTSSIEPLANGFYRCTITVTATLAATGAVFAQASAAMGTSAFSGNGTPGFFLWGADLRLSVDVHPSIPAYQRVTTATDYDTVGFPVYKRFDGVDDAYASAASLNLTGTDEVTVFAPVIKESDAAEAYVLEHGASFTTVGSSGVLAPSSSGAKNFAFRTVGAIPALAQTAATYQSPIKALITGIGKISTDTAIIRVNGVQAASSAADQGTGNYDSHVLYEGARTASTLYFKGESQGFLKIGKNLTASQLAIVEKYINNLWKAY